MPPDTNRYYEPIGLHLPSVEVPVSWTHSLLGIQKNDTSKSNFRRLQQYEYAPGPDDAADGDPIPAVALEADVEETILVVRPVAGVVSAPSRLDHDG